MPEIWDPNLATRHPCFAPLGQWDDDPRKVWPTLEEYNLILQQHSNYPIYSATNQLISFVNQDPGGSDNFSRGYEPRIYLQGEVQTRPQNWHDFFNFCCWLTFPKTKAQLNAIQYQSLVHRKDQQIQQRSLNENLAALFDECGIIVVSSNREYIELLQRHSWQDLFWENRQEIQMTMRFFIFGHGLYEKCLNPYLGLTGKGLCFHVAADFFSYSLAEQLKALDQLTLNAFSNISVNTVQEMLSPVPVLGYPNWHLDQIKEFYQNQHYFRPLPTMSR